MVISHIHRFIYIHVHRTGGTALMNELIKNHKHSIEVISEHGNMASSEGELIKNNPDYFVFGFVRNPWARLFSWYSLLNPHQNQLSPKIRQDFQKNLEQRLASRADDLYFHYNQMNYFPISDSHRGGVQYLRFEDYENELKVLHQRINLNLECRERVNVSSHQNYRAYYTKRSIDLVKELCSKDIDAFDYDF